MLIRLSLATHCPLKFERSFAWFDSAGWQVDVLTDPGRGQSFTTSVIRQIPTSWRVRDRLLRLCVSWHISRRGGCHQGDSSAKTALGGWESRTWNNAPTVPSQHLTTDSLGGSGRIQVGPYSRICSLPNRVWFKFSKKSWIYWIFSEFLYFFGMFGFFRNS